MKRIGILALMLVTLYGQAQQQVFVDVRAGTFYLTPFELMAGLRVEKDQVGIFGYADFTPLLAGEGMRFGIDGYAKLRSSSGSDVCVGVGTALYLPKSSSTSTLIFNGLLGLRAEWLRLEFAPEVYTDAIRGLVFLPTIRLGLSIPLLSGN
jgi:hypothetical protein